MAVPFNTIPSALRVPLFYAEMDNSAASSGATGAQKALLIGYMAPAGSAAADVPVQVTSKAQAATLFGSGSDLHRMCLRYLDADPFGELWGLPLTPASSSAATEDFTVVAASGAQEDGTLHLYLGGRKVEVSVSESDTANDIASAIASAISASTEPLGVTASAALAVVTLTYIHHGSTGDSFDVRANYYGPAGGETYPDGVVVQDSGANDIGVEATELGSGTAGGADASLTTAISNMGDEPFDFIGHGFANATAMDALETEMADRWGALQQVYGHVWTCKRDSQSNLTTLGNSRNDEHNSILGHSLTPTVDCELAAAWMGTAAQSLKIDPARPLQTLEVVGILPPTINDAFTITEQNTLLYDGISTVNRAGGKLRVTRCITTYQTNAAGDPDDSYLDVTTLYTCAAILRALKSRITSKFPRTKLVSDGTPIAEGAAIVSPSTIRAELVAQYIEMEGLGWVEDRAGFISSLIVERNATDPNRVDVLYPPNLVNGLRVMAVLNRFRL